MKILYLTSRLPIPPLVKGDTLRDFYIIKELASRGHKIILISYYENKEKYDPSLEILKKYCQDIKLVKFDKKIQSLNLLRGIFSLKPLQVLFYKSSAFQEEVNSLIRQEEFDVAYVHFARLADFLRGFNIPKIIDFQDSFEKNMKERFLKEKNIFLKIVAFIESERMKYYENQVSHDFSFTTVISERDLKPNHKNMFVVPNGIQDLKNIQERDKEAKGLLFMGNMSYFPNIDAALFLIKEVMPIILKKIPDLKLYIVGNKPNRNLKRYNSENVIVTGFVPEMYPYLAKSRIAVAPLRYGTGIQNKILDAMVAGIPQIISVKAANGFSNLSGKELLISEYEKQEFSDKIIRLWNNFELQDQLVANGKKYVLTNYSWVKSVTILESLFQTAIKHSENPQMDEEDKFTGISDFWEHHRVSSFDW